MKKYKIIVLFNRPFLAEIKYNKKGQIVKSKMKPYYAGMISERKYKKYGLE